MRIERFNEMFRGEFDYDGIINILKRKYDWGIGVASFMEDFESRPEYFLNPQDDRDYAHQFNIFLIDLENDSLRGEFQNNHSLKVGDWSLQPSVIRPTSIYNKLT